MLLPRKQREMVQNFLWSLSGRDPALVFYGTALLSIVEQSQQSIGELGVNSEVVLPSYDPKHMLQWGNYQLANCAYGGHAYFCMLSWQNLIPPSAGDVVNQIKSGSLTQLRKSGSQLMHLNDCDMEGPFLQLENLVPWMLSARPQHAFWLSFLEYSMTATPPC